jgi:tRNA threonylcarbamoyladenosine biosynthesis protein TsaB
MILLAIECASTTGGAAVLAQNRLVASLAFTSGALYSQRLLPSIEWLLGRAEIDIGAISAVAVSKGPGSFTGLRIGMSAAKAIAYANGAKLVGVNTLEAMALRAAGLGAPVCPLLDARQGEVYAALFAVSPGDLARRPGEPAAMPRLERLREDFVGRIEELRGWIAQPTFFLGEGALRYAGELGRMFGPHFVPAPVIRNLPSAEEVAYLGACRIAAGEEDDLALLEPDYLSRIIIKPKSR